LIANEVKMKILEKSEKTPIYYYFCCCFFVLFFD